MTARTATLALVLSALVLPAVAQVHRWVDEQGRVHYGDRPLASTGSTLRIRAESATAPRGASPAAAAARPSAATAPRAVPAAPGMTALVAQCKARRGVDCDTPQGMRHLQRENTPITREEQARITGLRARRTACARAPGSLGC